MSVLVKKLCSWEHLLQPVHEAVGNRGRLVAPVQAGSGRLQLAPQLSAHGVGLPHVARGKRPQPPPQRRGSPNIVEQHRGCAGAQHIHLLDPVRAAITPEHRGHRRCTVSPRSGRAQSAWRRPTAPHQVAHIALAGPSGSPPDTARRSSTTPVTSCAKRSYVRCPLEPDDSSLDKHYSRRSRGHLILLAHRQITDFHRWDPGSAMDCQALLQVYITPPRAD